MALEFLQKRRIAHRDVRSDNLLLNKNGVLKIGPCVSYIVIISCWTDWLVVDLADFSNAVRVTSEAPECTGAAGVIYWQVGCKLSYARHLFIFTLQAPEMRT